MPLDGGYGKSQEQINRQLLIDELRRPQPNFYWAHPLGCAMGIAWRMGICSEPTSSVVGPAIGLPRELEWKMFMNCAYPLPWWKFWKISAGPKDIARALERAPFAVNG